MQETSTKIEEAVKAKTTGITEPVNEQAVVPVAEDPEEHSPDYLLHDMDGGEG